MRLVSTAEAGTDPLGQLVASQQTRGLDDGALGVHPLGLDRIEPRTLAGQVAHHAKRAHALTLPFYLTALLANPGRHGLAAMPRRIVPDQGQSLDTLAGQGLATPLQKVDRDRTDRPTVYEAQQRVLQGGGRPGRRTNNP